MNGMMYCEPWRTIRAIGAPTQQSVCLRPKARNNLGNQRLSSRCIGGCPPAVLYFLLIAHFCTAANSGKLTQCPIVLRTEYRFSFTTAMAHSLLLSDENISAIRPGIVKFQEAKK